MNCLDVRRALLSAPSIHTPQMESHLHQCHDCRLFLDDIRHGEGVLKQAIDIPVPPHLAERVLLSTSLKKQKKTSHLWYSGVAVAACLVLAIFLLPQQSNTQNWNEIVLSHVLDEKGALLENQRLSSSTLSEALAPFGLAIQSSINDIRYLSKCDLPGGKGLHIVVNTPELGLVTLIVPPVNSRVSPSQSPLSQEGFIAQVKPLGHTNIGLVTAQTDAGSKLDDWLAAHFIVRYG